MEGFSGMPQQSGHVSAAHTGRNIFIVIGAVLIIAAGVVFFAYRQELFPSSAASAPLPSTSAPAATQEPATPQAKAQVLQAVSVSSSSTQAAATPAERAQIL